MRPSGPREIGSFRCGHCGGTAFERDMLRRAVGDMPRRTSPRDSVFDLTATMGVACTRCATPMQSIVIDARTLIDRCHGCGLIWVDVGELAPLAEFVHRNLSGARPPANFEEILAHPSELRAVGDRVRTQREPADAIEETAGWALVLLWLLGG